MNKKLNQTIEEHISLFTKLKSDHKFLNSAQEAVNLISLTIKRKGVILVFGNGGSAADANHLSAELVCSFKKKDRESINCISLNSNPSIITAWGNDINFDDIFSRQISSFKGQNVICLGISTSGRSKNVINGLKMAKYLNFKTISLTGNYVKTIEKYSDVIISINSSKTDRVQEAHLMTYHYLCEEIENKI